MISRKTIISRWIAVNFGSQYKTSFLITRAIQHSFIAVIWNHYTIISSFKTTRLIEPICCISWNSGFANNYYPVTIFAIEFDDTMVISIGDLDNVRIVVVFVFYNRNSRRLIKLIVGRSRFSCHSSYNFSFLKLRLKLFQPYYSMVLAQTQQQFAHYLSRRY
jgi:hypothetical protein